VSGEPEATAEETANSVGFEEKKLAIEQQKADTEHERLEFDRERLIAENRAKRWSQWAVLIPVLTAILGFFATRVLDHSKQADIRKTDARQFHRDTIVKQLNELYYPLYWRAVQDDSVWDTAYNSDLRKVDPKAADEIKAFLPRNHQQILSLFDEHPDLIRNSYEAQGDVEPFINVLTEYRRHVAVFLALRAAGSQITPYNIAGHPYPYPDRFSKTIEERIGILEKQLRDLR
jgi:hypothetical protein